MWLLMGKFEPLSPEEVKLAEKKAVEKFTGPNDQPAPGTSDVASVKEAKRYESLTPPWTKSWLSKYLLPFTLRPSQTQEIREPAKEEGINEEEKQSRVLGRFKSAFPFMLFPDELIIEEKRVIWKNWMGPGYTRVISIMASDISNVQASHGPILGHIHVGSLVGGPEVFIEKLWRKDCVKARALIEGIILAARERAAVRKEEVEREEKELEELGKVKF